MAKLDDRVNMTANAPQTTAASGEDLNDLEIYKSYKASKYLSYKFTSYFPVYEELLSPMRGGKITFVEIGVLNGGSLFMWRNFFGDQARIIGIDLNPQAKKWEEHGFEIFIGNQADESFWDGFLAAVGKVDVILDDGGHTNEQQVVTAHKCIPHINDGGLLIVEDTHTSYWAHFGNPSRYSFMVYSKRIVDGINSRFPEVEASKNPLVNIVYSMSFYESIVCFKIDRTKCKPSVLLSNGGETVLAQDFRYNDSRIGRLFEIQRNLKARFHFLSSVPLVRNVARHAFQFVYFTHQKRRSSKLRKYFT